MRFAVILIFISASISVVFPQADTSNSFSALEVLLEDAVDENEDSHLYDIIENLIENPININTASINDLMKMPLLNYSTASEIIRYRNLQGGINSYEQLKNIQTVDSGLIEKIFPFIKFDDKHYSPLQSIQDYFQNVNFTYRLRTSQDVQTRNGFANGKYVGQRYKLYNRLQAFSDNKFRAGILIEKDAGEKSLTDFTAYYLCIDSISIFSNIILGDYLFEFGQGIVIWGPYSFSKGSDAIGTASKNHRNTIPYLSANENQYFKGISSKINFGNFSITPFISYRMLDASIDSSTNKTTSIVIDGYHRTESELRKKDRLKENIYGVSADYTFMENQRISLLYYQTKFNNDFEGKELYKPSGNSFEYLSLGYSSFINKLYLSGEISYDMMSVASINIAEFLVDRRLSLVFSYRSYPRNFISMLGSPFGEKGYTQNETGFYTGLNYRSPYGTFNIYYDQFQYPIADNTFLFPSHGNEILFYYNYKILKNTEIRFRYKNENKELPGIINEEYSLLKRKTQNFRGEISYKVDKNIQCRTRIEFVKLSFSHISQSESGFLAFQDFRFTPINNLNVYCRIAFFRTDSYNSRIYEFENDLTGVMTNIPMYGEGLRWYMLAKYNTTFGLNVSIKYSELYKPNERTIGSGYSEILGNLDNKISLQLDYRF